MILTTCFCKVQIFPLLEELAPQKYSVFYKRVKVYIVIDLRILMLLMSTIDLIAS